MVEHGAKVFGDGVLTANPEIRVAGNTRIANFGMAFTSSWGQGNNRRQDVTTMDCEAQGLLADVIAKETSKGTRLHIEGWMVQKTWEHEGKRRSKLVLRVEEVSVIAKCLSQD